MDKRIRRLIEAETGPVTFHYALFDRGVPARNESRFYYLSWQATLLETGAVVRLWGRKGGAQREQITPFASVTEAWPLLRRVIRTRLRRGYRVVRLEAD